MESRQPLKELFYRLSDPVLVASHAFRQITRAYDSVSPSRFSRLYRMVRDLTMCSGARLRGLDRAVRQVVATTVPGNIVECGSARGGSAALMGLVLKELGAPGRRLLVFDTFEGLPAPSAEDPDYDIAKLYTGTCLGTIEDVTASFQRLGVLDRAEFIKGLFSDTLPDAPTGAIAVLHIDGDWYESVKTCLDELYDKVSPGGIIQFDDYGFWQGARKAVDEFFARRGIRPALRRLDYSGRQFFKPL